MNYKTILVHADTEADLAHVMPAAMAVARRDGAHIIGLHVIRNPVQTVYSPYQVEVLTEVIDQMIATAQEQADALRATFEQMIGGEVGIDGEWRTVTSVSQEVDTALVDHARCADMLIMAQPDPGQKAAHMIGTIGRVMLQVGRPLLVVPYAGHITSLGNHVLVAWSGTRESVRAVHDAMPVLQGAKDVRLCAIESNTKRDSATLPGAEMSATLARHGVTAIAETITASGSIAETLLSRAADHGSDLLVMGGYGHSRAREYVFGGVTRQILRSMTIPVLLSH
jgi:nucleotide-binding universal stress UspA family protein